MMFVFFVVLGLLVMVLIEEFKIFVLKYDNDVYVSYC